MRLITLQMAKNGGEMTLAVDHIIAITPQPNIDGGEPDAMILMSTMMQYFPTYIKDRAGGSHSRITYRKLCEILEQTQ